MPHKIEIGDEVKWHGHMRKITKLLGITIALDGVEDVICVPIDATRAEVFKDAATNDEQKL